MSFAAPLALWFFSLFIPVILLYLLKQRRRRVRVSTLLFWDRILRDEQSVTSITRLKKILSLLLQLLFITLLTLALSRPFLAGAFTGARRLVLFLDTSASMTVQEEGKSRFDLAREKCLAVIRGMSMGDSAMLVCVASAPEIVQPFTSSRKVLAEAVRNLRPSPEATRFRDAMELLAYLPPDERETDVYIASDGAFEPVEIVPPAKTRFAFLPAGKEKENVGITAFQIRPLPSSPRDFQIYLELSNETGEEKQVPIEFRVNHRTLDMKVLTLPAHGKLEKTYNQFSAQGDEIEAVLDYPDPFPLDNQAYGVLPEPRPITVLLVSEGQFFLENVLKTDDEIQLRVIDPGLYRDTGTYDVTLFDGVSPASTPEGNSIFIQKWPEDLGLVRRGYIQDLLFTDWDKTHPLHRHLAFANVTVDKAVATQAVQGFQALASSWDDPLILLREREGQKILITTFDFDPASTNMPLRVAFPILMANAIRYFAARETGEDWINPVIGEMVPLAIIDLSGPSHSALGEQRHVTTILKPDGAKFPLDPQRPWIPVDQAGIYRGERPDGFTRPLFAANLADRDESRIAPSETLPLRSKEPLPLIQTHYRFGAEPWFALVFLGLLLSITEWVFFHRRMIE